MTTEKQTEVAPVKEESNTTKPEVTNTPERTIPVDIFGEQIELPLSKAKAIIAKRDEKVKGYRELQEKVTAAEAQAKQEAERATLLSLMKTQDAEAVEAQVSQKYKDIISKFERKVYDGAIKEALAKNGVLSEALADAAKLVVSEVKPELDGDDVKLAGKKSDEYIQEWVKNRPHLLSVKAVAPNGKKIVAGGKPGELPKPEKSVGESLKAGISKFMKQ